MLSMMMICYSAECEEHYMRCYIDEPCEALQIPGMMASFFRQIKKLHSVVWLEIGGNVV